MLKYFKIKYLKISLFFTFFLILVLFFLIYINKVQKEKDVAKADTPITVNLLTSVHPKLSWIFKPIKPKIFVKPGDVTTIEYMVENLDNKNSTGIATFSYFPNEFASYISKLNCFCYDAQTLKAKQKGKYSVVLLIDPEVTKNSKTKNIKEVTIQFTFFNYKDYKNNES